MKPLHLIEIGKDGIPAVEVALTDMTRSACEATGGLYQRVGFRRPWIGYLAEQDGQLIGMCGFKSPPQNGRVEIAYGTTPGNEGRGIATQMARQLVQMARETELGITVVAQTLPEEGASTAILRKLGFVLTGTVHHPEDGDVWEWCLTKTDEAE
ncbi:MAG: GNAT family N-acetyltransferase [Planctomycetes bacterium]|nr:GNAT family N-acetyltransferase [Planctomycetota bacterium]